MPKESTAPKKRRFKKAVTSENVHSELVRRVPPHSAEAEQAVLAGLFSRTSPDELHSRHFKPGRFCICPRTRLFCRHPGSVFQNAPIDLVSCAETLKDKNDLETAGGAVLSWPLAPIRGRRAPMREYYAGICAPRKQCSDPLSRPAPKLSATVSIPLSGSDELLDQSGTGRVFNFKTHGRQWLSAGRELVEKVFENLSALRMPAT